MAANEEGRAAVTLYMDPADLAEVDQLARAEGVSRAEWFRRLVTRFIEEGRAPGQPDSKVDRRAKKARVLEAVEEHFHLAVACKEANVDRAEVYKLMAEDLEFSEAIGEAQHVFIDGVEAVLLRCAKGKLKLTKAAVTALIAFLNAHHYAWGRVKVEFLNRVINPLMDLLLRILADELGPAGADTLKRVADKFAREKELRLAAFSE